MEKQEFNQFLSLTISDVKAKFEKWWLLDDIKTGKKNPSSIDLCFNLEDQIMRVKLSINEDGLDGGCSLNNMNIPIKEGVFDELNDGNIQELFHSIMDVILETLSAIKPYEKATCGDLAGEDIFKYMNGSIVF